jgi:hypothetical protein
LNARLKETKDYPENTKGYMLAKRMYKPNLGPLDTTMPTENRFDEWLVPEDEIRYNRTIKKIRNDIQLARKKQGKK